MAHEPGDGATTGDVTVPLHSRRRERAQFVQHIRHAIPTVGLLAAAAQSLAAGAHGLELALAIAEIATSALLISSIVRGARSLHTHDHHHGHTHHAHGIEWIDIFAAGVLLAEAAEHWHVTHHVAGPTILTALVTLTIGLMHTRLSTRKARRRSLRLTDEHLFIPGRPFRSIKARWNEIAHVSVTEHQAEIRLHDGTRRRINLRDMRNAAEVRDALLKAHTRLTVGTPGVEPR